MQFRVRILQASAALRDFITPSYRPELHYMRGPGPAYMRRVTASEGRRHGLRLGSDATLSGSRGDGNGF